MNQRRPWGTVSELASWLIVIGILAPAEGSLAQNITLDGTLGSGGTLTGPNYVIPQAAGQTVGGNLFHSFGRFNLNSNEVANFQSAGITNILARITGGRSDIDGLMRSQANLFLINPNGIIFGPNAQLDIRGSFVATTANAIRFGDRGSFGLNSKPSALPLLTVNPSAFLFNQLTAQPIINRSVATSGGLRVDEGRSLLLVGGEVRLDGAGLAAPGGRIELGGLAEAGAIGLTMNGNLFNLTFPVNVARSDVSLINGSFVDVTAGNGGSIAINARNLDVSGDSVIRAGIADGQGTVGSQAGDIAINATEAVTVRGNSFISNNLGSRSVGKGGNIYITTRSLSVMNSVQVSASTLGRGDAGSIFIDARDTVSFDRSYAFSSVEQSGIGQGGNIRITTGFLFLTNGAQLFAGTLGRGDAGSIFIDARDSISFDSISQNNGFPSAAFSSVGRSGIGQGGSIRITTGSLSLTNGGGLSTETSGQGNAGNIFIDARDTVSLDGVSPNGAFPGGVFSSVSDSGIGQGGNIRIVAGSFSVTNGAQLSASTFGRGDAGSIFIDARDRVSFDRSSASSSVEQNGVGQGGNVSITTGFLSLTNGAQLAASTRGRGDAGNIFVDARNTISFDGINQNGGFPSAAFSSVEESGIGQGGNIRITTGSLFLTNGGGLSTVTAGQGNAGNIFVDVRDTVSLDGVSPNGTFPGGVFSSVAPSGIGQGGNIRIVTGFLSVTHGARLQATTFGRGDAGSIFVDARDTISFDGTSQNGRIPSSAFSDVAPTAIGKGGDITLIAANSVAITNGARVSASSDGTGGAGNIRVGVPDLRLDKASITSETASGNGGNIALTVPNILLLRRGSTISTTAGTAQAGGDGGNITFNSGFVVAVPSENSDITANAFTGRGGNVDITAQGLFGIQFQSRLTPLSDITASSEFGVAGIVNITTPDVDPNRGLVALPTEPRTPQVAEGCQTTGSRTASRFVVTGRGGLPENPREALSDDEVQVGLVTLSGKDEGETKAERNQSSEARAETITEATGWVVDSSGTVSLVAQAPANLPAWFWQPTSDCQKP